MAVLAYVLTSLLLSRQVKAILLRHASTYTIPQDAIPAHVDGMPVLKLVGWLFCNAHGGQGRFAVADASGANPSLERSGRIETTLPR